MKASGHLRLDLEHKLDKEIWQNHFGSDNLRGKPKREMRISQLLNLIALPSKC